MSKLVKECHIPCYLHHVRQFEIDNSTASHRIASHQVMQELWMSMCVLVFVLAAVETNYCKSVAESRKQKHEKRIGEKNGFLRVNIEMFNICDDKLLHRIERFIITMQFSINVSSNRTTIQTTIAVHIGSIVHELRNYNRIMKIANQVKSQLLQWVFLSTFFLCFPFCLLSFVMREKIQSKRRKKKRLL